MTYRDSNTPPYQTIPGTGRTRATSAAIEADLRAYMLRIYNNMAAGLTATGIVAYIAASSGFYQSIAGPPVMWIVIRAPLGFVLALSFGIERISLSTAQIMFWIYAGDKRGDAYWRRL